MTPDSHRARRRAPRRPTRLRTVLPTILVTTATAAALLVGVVPAEAARVGVDDPRGDAGAATDVTRLAVDNQRRRVVAVLTVPRLALPAVSELVVGIVPQDGGRDGYWTAVASRAREGAPLRRRLRFGLSATVPVRCDGLAVRFRARSVRVSVPRRCLGGRGPDRFFASVASYDTSTDVVPRGLTRTVARG